MADELAEIWAMASYENLNLFLWQHVRDLSVDRGSEQFFLPSSVMIPATLISLHL